jgi:hypothetical protein
MSNVQSAGFDGDTLTLLDRAMEVDIETIKPDGMPRRTTIWLIVDRGEVFVRSWRGDHAHWYQAALDAPDGVTLHVGKTAIPVRVVPAVDKLSISRCSRALESKYAGDPATPSMVRPSILGTTLRLEPRA